MTQQVPTRDERARPFLLCADDFALTPAVSRGILRLLDIGRVTATGAMTNRPHWSALAGELAAFAGRADLGVHLNLTAGAPLGPMPIVAPAGALPPLARLARLALLSPAARAEIAAEIVRQLDAFAEAMSRAPDFVDGHQHVHALPGVRGGVMAALAGRGVAYVRDPADSLGPIAARGGPVGKALTVAALASGFGAAVRRAGLAVNRGFSGFSAFDAKADYGAEFAGALRAPGPAPLVMCHPGEIDAELRRLDPVVETRPRELAFLASDRFLDVCAAAGLAPARMADVIEGG